ncbi:MAG: hypothetical protein IRZ16_08145 [Myxococcaceae bacterium]|nr:hypothetical protein [Myxococcaceae bacterium]
MRPSNARWLLAVPLVASLLHYGCGPQESTPPPPPPPQKIHTTWRILSGVSMGAIGTAALGLSRPDRFDGVGILGGPLDAALLLRTIDRFHLGGFCRLEDLEAIAAEDPSKLNDPATIHACERPATPIRWEHPQDFNHWVFTTNGGTFDRSSYLDLFKDLTLAYGNVLYDNPESPFAPPGVPVERLRHPPPDFCTNPVVVKGLKNAEYNPTGKYDAITFCDGQPRIFYCRADLSIVDFCSDPANVAQPIPAGPAEEAFANEYCKDKGGAAVANKSDLPLVMLDHAGQVDACRQMNEPVLVALAVDINGNGRRDYGEPLINNGYERFDDVGVDGCANVFEDGAGGCTQTPNPSADDPNGDDYDADRNPLGTENNWIHDDGEPFRDDGLDGVPDTGDEGEGNGVYDLSRGRQAMFGYDARTNYRRLDDAGRHRINVLADGGIRDLFNFGLASKQVFGLVKHFRGPSEAQEYRDFVEIPKMVDEDTGAYDPWGRRWTDVGPNLAIYYGKEQPSDQDRIDGEGDHVGTPTQAVNRFYTLFNWAAAQWPSLPRPKTPFGGKTYSERAYLETYDSALLGGKREYAIYLPPGYDLPENAETRYPVLLMLHGYGMEPKGFLDTALIADSYMLGDHPKLRPMIIVFPSGRCCFTNAATGARDCRERDDQGTPFESLPGWERECESGSFYVNRHGFTGDDAVPYGDAVFELMDHIDAKYRTLRPDDVEAR